MSVQDLIDKLMLLEDKSIPVCIEDTSGTSAEYDEINSFAVGKYKYYDGKEFKIGQAVSIS